jgi:hypothetical protein
MSFLLTLALVKGSEGFGGKSKLNVLFFAADDLRYQLGTSGPGDVAGYLGPR